MRTVYNLRHNVTIITITIGFTFQIICVHNVKPSLLRLPDRLRELFDSPSAWTQSKSRVRLPTDPNLWRYSQNGPVDIFNAARLLSVVEEVSVARVLLPARGLSLGAGSDMLKESTRTFAETSFINI